MKTPLKIIWALLCAATSIIPAYFLFAYRDPGAGNFGWEMFLGAILFWISGLLAILFAIVNGVILVRKPTLFINRHVAFALFLVTLAPLLMSAALLLQK